MKCSDSEHKKRGMQNKTTTGTYSLLLAVSGASLNSSPVHKDNRTRFLAD
jgi:hypothetical protein